GEDISFTVPLERANVTFDASTNSIHIEVSREELGMFGIAPRFGAFELPAKLSNFTIGVRCYQTPTFKLPWNRITVNTNFLINTIEKLHTRPMLSKVAEYLLQHYANMTWEDYKQFINATNQTMPLPDSIALKDMEMQWTTLDVASNKGKTSPILFIRPTFFDDLRVNALGFISKDYSDTKKPIAGLILLQLNITGGYENMLAINRNILHRISELDASHPYVSVEATGDGVISAQIDDVTSEANRVIGPSIFLVIMFILFISFRKLSYIVLPLVSLCISAIWVFGTMVLLNIPFTTMAVAIIPLLMGLGVDYSVHLSHTYRSELEKGRKPGDAIKRSIQEIGRAMFLAMLTTVITFLSFLSATVPPIRDFGLLLALGILYTFITAVTLQASVRYIIDRKKTITIQRKNKSMSLHQFMGKIAQIVMHHQRTIIGILIIVSLVMGIGAMQIKTGFDFKSFVPENNPAIELFDTIAEKLPYASQDQEFILIEGEVATVKTLKGIKQTHENLDDDTFIARQADGSVKAYSIYTLIQQVTTMNKTLITQYN
ncbi:MAG TPA: hypothetical protein ENI45_00385, partial [Thermoplasmatales archaeon]|nr:hypothetical protein [Thermoplasmatales archaeon]